MARLFRTKGITEYHETVKAAIQFIPKWYKEMPIGPNGQKPRLGPNGEKIINAKSCIPFLDAITSGYVAVLQQDLQVEQTENGPYFSWNTDPAPMGIRNDPPITPVPNGYTKLDTFWFTNEVMQTPPGYSIYITHPANRYDLPFITLSGIVDADYGMEQGRIPFFIQEGFSGVIKKGTPIFQILPFRREAWVHEEDASLIALGNKNGFLTSSVIHGYYKRNWWHRKKFE